MLYFSILSVSPSPGDDGALAVEVGLVEEIVDPARFVDAARHQHRIAVTTAQSVAGRHVHLDVGNNLIQPGLAGEHLPHRAPALLELRLGKIGQPLRLGLEPLIDLGLRGDALIDVPGFIAQVEHHLVLHRLVESVSVDVAPENLDAPLLVSLEERSTRKADEHGAGKDSLHRVVQVS